MEYSVKLLEDILKIYSPTGCESRLCRYLEDHMKTLGFNVYVDDLGDVIGDLGDGSPDILLCGHMDTVPGEIPVRLEGYDLYGRGAVDAKGPLAAMITAAYEAFQEGLGAKVRVACLVDEEGRSRGARNLPRVVSAPEYAVFGEPSGTDDLIIGYKGSFKAAFHISASQGHSASPWLYTNAIEEAFELWKTVKSKVVKEGVDSHFHSITGCLTRMRGGGEFSTTPSQCVMEMDIRIPPEIEWMKVHQEVEKLASEQAKGKADLKIQTEKRWGLNALLTARDSPLVAAFSIAIRKVRDKQPILLKKTGTSDMNVLAEKWRIPMIAYGPGDSKLDHTPDEHTDVREYLSSIDVYKEALKRLKKMHKLDD